jgi:SNF2 family DNA or RNA helicase
MNVLEANFPGAFRIDGSLSKEEREAEIQGFKNKQGGAVFLIQIKAGGQGLNLQEATRVYITSPAWNPATELQAIARSHRTGQTQRVVVRKLIYNGTDEWPSVEQSICALQGHKSKVCSEVLNDPRLLTQIPGPRKAVGLSDILKIFRV